MHDFNDSFRDDDEPRSSRIVWDALCEAEREYRSYWNLCDRIEREIAALGGISGWLSNTGPVIRDRDFDIFWASLEIIKPAIYTRSPQPVVAPRFPDRDPVAVKASEVLERCISSSFDRGDFHGCMLTLRDDFVISGRGVPRVTYENVDGEGHKLCFDHVDRCDYLEEPARKWPEVGWVAFAAYLSERQFKKRFRKWLRAGGDINNVQFVDGPQDERRSGIGGASDTLCKAKVWEVWHKADNRVYWVTEGVETFLDESEPFINLHGFFPCPRPAYGTLQPRTLIPVPDYVRYASTLNQIKILTERIHVMLERVRMLGFFPGGGDVGEAIEAFTSGNSDAMILVPLPDSALTQGGGDYIQWLPIDKLAQTIAGLIEARRELINNFYELSGISDIMRGATEAQETATAQALKQHNGSVRIRDKIMEMQRVAVDVANIAGEIISEKFSEDSILEMSGIDLPTKREVEKNISDLENQARDELKHLEELFQQKVQEMQQSGEEMDPDMLQQQFQAQQQEILGKYSPQIAELGKTVTREAVFDVLRKDKTRAFAIEIQTDSTILMDEQAEKQSRAEFLQAFGGAFASIQPLLQAGEAGAKLAGGMIKFSLAPYRVGRELDGLIDEFIDQAPILAQQMSENNEEGQQQDAMRKLAEAEMAKAQAQTAKVQADSALRQQELQLKLAEAQSKAEAAQQKTSIEVEAMQVKLAEAEAKVNLMQAQTAEILSKIGLDVRKQDLEEYRVATDVEQRTAEFVAAEERAMRDETVAVIVDGVGNVPVR